MRHLLAGHGAHAVGAITCLYADKKHAKVKWDDGGPAMKSAFAHLQHNPVPDESDSDDGKEEGKEETALDALTGLVQEDNDSDADVPEEDDRE